MSLMYGYIYETSWFGFPQYEGFGSAYFEENGNQFANVDLSHIGDYGAGVVPPLEDNDSLRINFKIEGGTLKTKGSSNNSFVFEFPNLQPKTYYNNPYGTAYFHQVYTLTFQAKSSGEYATNGSYFSTYLQGFQRQYHSDFIRNGNGFNYLRFLPHFNNNGFNQLKVTFAPNSFGGGYANYEFELTDFVLRREVYDPHDTYQILCREGDPCSEGSSSSYYYYYGGFGIGLNNL